MQLRLYYLISFFTLIFVSCHNKNENCYLPPTDDVFVKEDMEYKKPKDIKSIWFEQLHKCAPETDWRIIEAANTERKYKTRLYNADSELVRIGGGIVTGSWEDKGSINQSGSVTKVRFNKIEQSIYLIADGGTIWKGGVGGLSWQAYEQDLRVDNRFLSISNYSDISTRVIVSINGFPYYKNHDSTHWEKSMISEFNSSRLLIKEQQDSHEGKYIFYLAQESNSETSYLILSKDYGLSYTIVNEFSSTKLTELSLDYNQQTESIYLMHQKSKSAVDFYRYSMSSDNFILIKTNALINLEREGSANLEVSKLNSNVAFYVYDESKRLLRSLNNGDNWQLLSQLAEKPWEVGIYISEINPNILMYGAVEAYRSIDGGFNWKKINKWTDYYSDKATKLHADIMDISEFELLESKALIVSNHGGLSISYNQGASYINLALNGLNISQYYSIQTYPSNHQYIFAGSQDQGLQRGMDLNEGPINMDQFISGDYGYLEFTNSGRSLWAVFPGGWISYYPQPLTGFFSDDYQLDDNLENNWLPPIIKSPFHPQGIILAGGKNDEDPNGAYLYSLIADDFGKIVSSRLPYNFSTSGGEISAIGSSPIISNDVYVTTSNGNFYYSTDVGNSFLPADSGLEDFPSFYCNKILGSFLNTNKIVLAGSGYSNPGVFISYNKGKDFLPLHDNLPQTTIFDLAYSPDESFLFAATESGPYVYSFDLGQWYDLSRGAAPNQRFWTVDFIQELNIIRWGSFGRGVLDFRIQNLSNLEPVDEVTINFNIHPNPFNDNLKISELNSNGLIKIYSSTGHLVKSKMVNQPEVEFNFSSLPNGIYYVIFEDQKNLVSKIIVKQ